VEATMRDAAAEGARAPAVPNRICASERGGRRQVLSTPL
jgi:hypothetical protein